MIDAIKSFFNKKKKIRILELDFNSSDTSEIKLCNQALMNKDADILWIKNFFDASTCNEIKSSLLSAKETYDFIPINDNDGAVFPIPYSMVVNEENRVKYFSMAKSIAEKQSVFLGSHENVNNFEERFQALFNQPISILSDQSNYFSRLNYRVLHPNKSGINVHCENAFASVLNNSIKKALTNNVELYNILPYFIVLQKPEKGGELIVFNEDWDNFKLGTGDLNKSDIVDKRGDFIKNKQLEVVHLSPNMGDLIIFRGAQLWHAINDIGGSKPRITMGGFVGYNKDKTKYYNWA